MSALTTDPRPHIPKDTILHTNSIFVVLETNLKGREIMYRVYVDDRVILK
jgi:hypothetical protein